MIVLVERIDTISKIFNIWLKMLRKCQELRGWAVGSFCVISRYSVSAFDIRYFADISVFDVGEIYRTVIICARMTDTPMCAKHLWGLDPDQVKFS